MADNNNRGKRIALHLAHARGVKTTGISPYINNDQEYKDDLKNYGYFEDKDYEKKLLQETESEYIVEVLPSGEDISYKKIILAVDKEKFYAKKVEFYDMSENLTKTLEITKTKIDDKGKITPMEILFTDTDEI